MPDPGTPDADLWPGLSSLLLRTFGWAALAAVLLGVIAVLVVRRRATIGSGARTRLFGDISAPEPVARRVLRVSFALLWIADGLLQAQPRMPGAFARQYLPGSVGPEWFAQAQAAIGRAWLRHPLAADAAAVWLQLGLGLLFLLGGRGLLNRVACAVAIGWSVVVWFFGESLGGLLTAGAGWLTGAPGSALLYAFAAVMLLQGHSFWQHGRAQCALRRSVAVWFVVAAILEALPGENFWTSGGLAMPFEDGRGTEPNSALRAPITGLAHQATSAPTVLNGLVVGVLAVLAVALWRSGRAAVVGTAALWCLATWWLAQDFGVLGGTGTDPNSALPLALLLVAALPVWSADRDEASEPQPMAPPTARRTLQFGAGAAAVTLAIGLVAVAPAVLAAEVPGPAGADAIAADSDGGLLTLPPRPMPAFDLRDQLDRRVTPATLRGKVVVLTFLDPVCSTDCPVIAAQLAMADRRLGGLASRVAFVALDTNPVFHTRADVRAFTDSHDLSGMPNWHFLWGRAASLQSLLTRFGVAVDVPAVGMIEHSEAVYFFDGRGTAHGYLDDGAADELTSDYARQLRTEVQALIS